jgi:hypothetical protein
MAGVAFLYIYIAIGRTAHKTGFWYHCCKDDTLPFLFESLFLSSSLAKPCHFSPEEFVEKSKYFPVRDRYFVGSQNLGANTPTSCAGNKTTNPPFVNENPLVTNGYIFTRQN